MTTFRHALILVPAALLLTGAKPADSLRATFADPGAEYRPVPFWHLNGRLSSDEIVRQLEDTKNLAGFGGVTVLLPMIAGLSELAVEINSAWQKECSLFFSVEEV